MLVEILFGSPGSGKSTYCKGFSNATIISQDEMGRKGHFNNFKLALVEKHEHIIVDRMGFNRYQRARYIQPALSAGYQVKFTIFFVPYEVALERVLNRENHPTIKNNDENTARKVLDFFFDNYEYPSESELMIEVPDIIE